MRDINGSTLSWGLTSLGHSDGKKTACNAGDLGLIPGLGRSPGGGNGNLFQYSCLENSMDREAWWATVHGVTKSQTLLIIWHMYHNSTKRFLSAFYNLYNLLFLNLYKLYHKH